MLSRVHTCFLVDHLSPGLSRSRVCAGDTMDDIDSKIELEELPADGERAERQPSPVEDEWSSPRELEDDRASPDTRRGSGAALLRYARRRSTAAGLAVERLMRTRERLWTTTVSTAIASIAMLLMGFTLGFPSASVLQLQELPGSRRFDTLQIDLFVVSAPSKL